MAERARSRWQAPPLSEYRLWVQRVIWAIAWLLTSCVRREIRGCVPDAPCILVSNHLNVLDIPIAGRYAVRVGERCHWLAKYELFALPIIGAVFRAMQAVEVHRGTADRRAIEQIAAYAQVDKVWIFPEGTRSRTGRLQAGKEGTVLVAKRANVPLVPVAISGTEGGALPLLLRRKTLRVAIGEPFRLPPGVARAAGIAEIMARIAALLPPEYRPSQYSFGLAEPFRRAGCAWTPRPLLHGSQRNSSVDTGDCDGSAGRSSSGRGLLRARLWDFLGTRR